jgi:hypothetical protein
MEYLLPIWIFAAAILFALIDWMRTPKVNRNLHA